MNRDGRKAMGEGGGRGRKVVNAKVRRSSQFNQDIMIYIYWLYINI